FAPYDADGNSVSPEKSGDPFGTDDLFPLLPGGRVADSSSLALVAGADSVGGRLSVDPTAVHAGTNASLTGAGIYSYALSQTFNEVEYDDRFDSTLTSPISSSASADAWVDDVTGKGLSVGAYASGSAVYYGTASSNSSANQAVLIGSGSD